MSERVPASITLGGHVTTQEFAELTKLIRDEDLSIDWDGDQFEPSQRLSGQPLKLFAYEVPLGRFAELEAWCVRKNLPFARWSGAYDGQWGAKRAVYTGDGEVVIYPVDEEDDLIINRDTVRALGTLEEIAAYFAKADAPIPPLVVDGDSETLP